MLIDFLDLNSIRIVLALAMLVGSSIIDLWKREVHDYYWMGFGAVGLVLLIFEPNIMGSLLVLGFSLIIAPLSLILWRIGLFGGADAFALIALAVISPMATIYGDIVTPFTTLSNAAVLFVIPIFANFARNMWAYAKNQDIFEGFDESKFKKTCAILIGYRAKKPKFAFAIEENINGKRKLRLNLHHSETEEYCNTPDTWITPGIPYLLMITGGYVIQLLYGDVILSWLI